MASNPTVKDMRNKYREIVAALPGEMSPDETAINDIGDVLKKLDELRSTFILYGAEDERLSVVRRLIAGTEYLLELISEIGLGRLAEARTAEGEKENKLGSDYFISVDASLLDPEVLMWVHAGQGDPVYALASRLAAYFDTMASPVELYAAETALEEAIQAEESSLENAEDDADEGNLYRMDEVLLAIRELLENHADHIADWEETQYSEAEATARVSSAYSVEDYREVFVAEYIIVTMELSEEYIDDSLVDSYTREEEIAPECLEKMAADAGSFFDKHYMAILNGFNKSRSGPYHGTFAAVHAAAQDFWLTRNGHGAGFWDGDWAESAATELTKASEAYGPTELYLGDDILIYCA